MLLSDPLPKPTLEHRAIHIDKYALGETTRSVRAGYRRVQRAQAEKAGIYKPKDWARMSFVLDETVKAGSVLDVGPNRGQFPNLLAESHQFSRVVAVDVRKNPKFVNLHPGAIEYLAMSVAELDFPNDAFDVVTCLEVLEHLEPDILQKGLRELRRVCKKQLIVTVPYAESFPLYRSHKRRFVDADFLELFPNGAFTLLRSAASQWMLVEELDPKTE